MNDQAFVDLLDRAAELQEDADPTFHAHPAFVAELVQRLAVDELHDEVRTPIFRGATVDETSDVRIFQLCENAALLEELVEEILFFRLEEFDREAWAGISILPRGEIDDAHSALVQPREDVVVAHPLSDDGFAEHRRSALRQPALRSNDKYVAHFGGCLVER